MKKIKKKKDVKSYWSMTEGVFNCLIDEERSLAFQKAINNTVKAGDVVVDMGTGSGILAMFAAKAGASKVYAVENDKHNILTLNNTFKVNGLDKILKIIEGDVTKVKLPEKVDVIIGEMIATALIEELQIPAMNNMLKYAKNDCKVLLNKYESYISLVNSPSSYYDLEFPVIRYEYPDLMKLKSKDMSDNYCYYQVDFTNFNKIKEFQINKELTIKKDGIINGLKLSSLTKFFDGSEIWSTFAYSYPIILPISKIRVNIGDRFLVKLKYKPTEGFGKLSYLVKLNKKCKQF